LPDRQECWFGLPYSRSGGIVEVDGLLVGGRLSTNELSKETLLAELTAEHRRLDELLQQLERRRALTPNERAEISRLKKQKLLTKDRITRLS
jgi:uncharacterized protein YdcH (DUF465 family)